MARNTTPAVNTDGTPKTRKARSPSVAKPVYAVIRILDADGHVMNIAKAQVEVISFERSAEAVLSKVESGDFPGALYLRGILPAGRNTSAAE